MAYLKTQDVADVFGVAYKTILRWRKRGWLRGRLIGNSYYYDPADIQRLMKSDEPMGDHCAAASHNKKDLGTD